MGTKATPIAGRRGRQHFKAHDTLEPQTHRCGRKSLQTAARQVRLKRRLTRHPDATLAELGVQFKWPTSTMDLRLARLGWSCEKTLHASEHWQPAVAAGRRSRTCPGVLQRLLAVRRRCRRAWWAWLDKQAGRGRACRAAADDRHVTARITGYPDWGQTTSAPSRPGRANPGARLPPPANEPVPAERAGLAARRSRRRRDSAWI